MKKMWLNILLLVVLLLVCSVWVCYSWTSPKSYFAAPLHSILTIAFGLFVSYYLVQKNTDKRRRCELAEKLLEQTKGKATEFLALLHNEDVNIGRVLGLKRAMINKLKNCQEIKLKTDLDLCIKEIEKLDRELENLAAEQTKWEENIINQKPILIKTLQDIEYHCDNAIVCLWKNK